MYLIQLGPVVYERRGGGGFTLPEALREVYGVGWATILRQDGTVAVADAGSATTLRHVSRAGVRRTVSRRRFELRRFGQGAYQVAAL